MANTFFTYNDRPVNICSMGRNQLREEIVNQIAEAKPPKVIAIHGTWGSGKTSLLAQIYARLGGDYADIADGNLEKEVKKQYPVKPVWFEAWQYQHESNILAALLKEIRDQLSLPFKLWKEIDEALVPTALAALQSIELTFSKFETEFGFKGFATKVAENVKEYQKERVSTPLDSLMLKKLLKEAIDQLLGFKHLLGIGKKKHRKVVIFIDDLDRCEPEITFRILETIKVYLNLDNCVFVLAMDTKIVEQILAKHHEKQLNQSDPSHKHLKNLARLYLEKICQDIYHLPVPTPEDRATYFTALLDERMGADNALAKQIAALAKDYKFLPPFPRSIKILANTFITHSNRASVQKVFLTESKSEQEIDIRPFVILGYLYAFHFEVYELCYLYLDQDFYNSTFLEYCKNPEVFREEKGAHPVLESLTIPETTFVKALEGKTNQELLARQIQRTFPHESLRQVLWIRKLVIEKGIILPVQLEALKF